MVVVKGEIKMAVVPLGGLVLGAGSVNVLLLICVLMVVVVVVLLVKGVGCSVVVVVDCVVLKDDIVVGEFLVLVVEARVVVASLTEAVVVSCRGGRGDT